MSLEVNGAAILSALAASPSAFGMDEAEVNGLALATLLGRLKTRTLTLDGMKALRQAIGAEDFRLALDHLGSKDTAALAKRFDAKNPDLPDSADAWRRTRLIELAEGAEPWQAGTKPARKTTKSPPKAEAGEATRGAKTGVVMKSKALRARATNNKG